MNIALPTRMTVDEFLAWAVRQELQGRYELFNGRVVMQQAQNWGHAKLCWHIRGLLTAAIERAGLPFYAAPMGMTVRITKDFAFEPDALVAPLPEPQRTDLEIANPVIVVEVLSPSTAKRDRTDKLAGYIKVPSIEHYLIVDPEEHEVTWYHRAAGGAFAPPISVREGASELDPPGITLAIAEIFAPET
jgi:Uma2 family endonuclease